MKTARRRWAAMVRLALATNAMAACGTSVDTGPPAEALPCDVERVLSHRCQICHSDPPAAGAPFSLVTFADTRRTTRLNRAGIDAPVWKSIGEVLEDGLMPLDPASGNPAPMAQGEPDRTTLLSWVDAGAPPSTSTCAAPGGS